MSRRHLPLLLALLVLPPTIFFGVRTVREKTRRIPEKRLWMQTLDTTNFFRTSWGAPIGYPAKNRGTATVACEKFLLRFDGESFMPDGIIGGEYTVDGRYGGFFPPNSESLAVPENSGVTYSYLASTRTLHITYKTHRIFYRHFENTLEVGGRKYRTSPGFLALSIAKNRRVQTLKLPPEIDVPSIVNGALTVGRWPVAPQKGGAPR